MRKVARIRPIGVGRPRGGRALVLRTNRMVENEHGGAAQPGEPLSNNIGFGQYF
jgi:hypothetical protein